MREQISESDWKIFRQVHRAAVERFCESILSEAGRIASDTNRSPHERYLAVWDLLRRRDRELGQAFDDVRRSTAWLQLTILRRRGLMSAEELARFSPETIEAVKTRLEGLE